MSSTIDSKDPFVSDDAAAGFVVSGMTALSLERFETAAGLLEMAALNPRTPDLSKVIGSCYHRMGRKDVAARWYSKSIAADPDQADVLTNLGEILLASLEYGAALELFKRAMALDPDGQDPHANRARALIMGVTEDLSA